MHPEVQRLRDRRHVYSEHSAARGPAVDSDERLQRLLGWMARQDFATVTAGEHSLLRQVEGIVVESHRRLYAARGKPWSKPIAYHWLRYEDPLPVARLQDGVKRLRRRGAPFDAEAVEKACMEAGNRGFLN